MGQVIVFKKKKKISEMYVEFQWEILEDGSIWYRVKEISRKEWGEWIKLESNPE